MNYCLWAARSWIVQMYRLNPALKAPIKWDELPVVMHSGLTNWPKVMEGWMDTPDGDTISDYDIIHFNYSKKSVGSIKNLRLDMKEFGVENTKIVANVDYAPEMWETFDRFDYLLEELKMCDSLFCVHPVMSETLSVLLDKKVHTIQHPTDVNTLRTNFNNMERVGVSGQLVTVVSHPYDQNYRIITEIIKKLKNEYPDLKAVLVGPMEKNPSEVKWVYDDIHPVLDFHDMFRLLAISDVVIDTAVTHSGGRIPVECAVVETPCIADEKVQSANHLFEDLSVNIFDGEDVYSTIECILQNHDFHVNYEDADFYNYENSKQKFISMLEEDSK